MGPGFSGGPTQRVLVDHSPPETALVMLPEVEARALLGDRRLAFRLLRPPYPALGLGTLRVLRVCDGDGVTQVVAGYDGYERLEHERRDRPGAGS